MSKIYDDAGTRMTNEQVATTLQTLMPSDHKALMAIALKNSAVSDDNPRRKFAHAVVDTYSKMETSTPDHEKSKKYAKYLLDKYMKSTATPTKAEEDSITKLIAIIMAEDTTN